MESKRSQWKQLAIIQDAKIKRLENHNNELRTLLEISPIFLIRIIYKIHKYINK